MKHPMKKNNIYTVAALILVATLHSCGVSKDVTYPVAALPESFRGAEIAADDSSIASLPWSDFFVEEALRPLIENALQKNNQMQLALKNIEIAQLQWTKSKWGNIPELQLGIQANSSRPSENSLTGTNLNMALSRNHIEDYSVNLGLSWEADIWGKIKNQKKGALAQYLQTEEAQKTIQTTLIAEVAKGYYNLLMLDYQLETAKKNAALNDSTRSIIQWQFEAGQVTSLAVAQIESQKLNAEKLIPLFEQQIAIQENALSLLTGTFPTAIERSAGLPLLPYNSQLKTGLPTALVSNRPDVKQAELALNLSNAQVGMAKADFYPSLKIGASTGLNSFETSNWFTIPASLFGTIAGGITQPLLQGKTIKTKYKIALIEREKAVINFRESVLIAVSEVSNALVSIEKLNEQQQLLQNQVQTLEKAIGKANLLYRSGLVNYLEVISSQAQLLNSELELATSKRDLLAARVELYRSLGGGWQ